MKKILLVIGLLFSSLAAQAGPVEDLTAAFAALQDAKPSEREQAQGTTQSVIRGYLASQSGFTTIPSATQGFGILLTKGQIQSAAASLGYTFVATQRKLDIYRAPATSPTVGFFMLVYYDALGYASELYLVDDQLP